MLKTDTTREGNAPHADRTGFYVRAIGRDGTWGNFDIAELDRASLLTWVTAQRGTYQVAVPVLLRLLDHETSDL